MNPTPERPEWLPKWVDTPDVSVMPKGEFSYEWRSRNRGLVVRPVQGDTWAFARRINGITTRGLARLDWVLQEAREISRLTITTHGL